MIHKYRLEIVQEVKSWYTCSYPELGYIVEERKFGFYRRNNNLSISEQVTIRNITLNQISDFFNDLKSYYNNNSVRIYIDKNDLEKKFRNTLIKNGCVKNSENIFLAYVGDAPENVVEPNLDIELVDEKTLADYVYTKIKGFANSEDEPSKEKVKVVNMLKYFDG